MDTTTVGDCTSLQKNGVQNDFEQCSDELIIKVWDDINKMEEKIQKGKGK